MEFMLKKTQKTKIKKLYFEIQMHIYSNETRKMVIENYWYKIFKYLKMSIFFEYLLIFNLKVLLI